MEKIINLRVFIIVVAVTAVVVVQQTTEAQNLVVGDSMGWTLPPDCLAYATWASHHKFEPGVTLEFRFEEGSGDVAGVSPEDFKSCNTSNPDFVHHESPLHVILANEGDFYFTTTYPNHCIAGQKLHIHVHY